MNRPVYPWPFPADPKLSTTKPAAFESPAEVDMEPSEEPADRVCPECNGDGGDKWNDYILPCPMCNGERYLP